MNRITFSPGLASDHVSPAFTFAEQNLGALARFTAARMDGGADDTLHLSATFTLLRARQAIRQGIRDVATLRREVRA